MTAFTSRKTSPRLERFDYRGQHAYFVTINTQNRQRELGGEWSRTCVSILAATAAKLDFEMIAFTFMPDHVHLLAAGTSDTADLVKFMQKYKQLTGFAYKRQAGRQLWRRSYYDRVLRSESEIADIAAYIWHNPVRGGLTHDAASYPFSGPADRFEALASDRAEALSLRLGPLFEQSARCA